MDGLMGERLHEVWESASGMTVFQSSLWMEINNGSLKIGKLNRDVPSEIYL